MEEFDIQTTVLTQYQKSPAMLGIIDTFKYIDPANGVNEIYGKIWNIKTANSYGLDIWGLILNVDRVIEITSGDFFGFAGTGFSPFNVFPFYNGKATGYYRLDTEAYRELLLISASRDTSDVSLTTINQITAALYGARGICKVEKISTMKLRFTFDFIPENFEIALLKNESIVPVPTGVDYEIIIP